MLIRHHKLSTGQTYTVFEVRESKTVVGQKNWRVLCGAAHKMPEWVPLRIGKYGTPYFWFDGRKHFLDDFKVA